VEPFAAILIAHGTHVFFGRRGDPEAQRAKIRGQGREQGRGQQAPCPVAGGSGGAL